MLMLRVTAMLRFPTGCVLSQVTPGADANRVITRRREERVEGDSSIFVSSPVLHFATNVGHTVLMVLKPGLPISIECVVS